MLCDGSGSCAIVFNKESSGMWKIFSTSRFGESGGISSTTATNGNILNPEFKVITGSSWPTTWSLEIVKPISSLVSRNAVSKRSESSESNFPPGNEISPAWNFIFFGFSVITTIGSFP